MANLIDIRRRIRSVKSTQQITRAMKFVAAAKLRKAQAQTFAVRPYARRMFQVIHHLAMRVPDRSHPLLEDRGEGRILLVMVSGDKGLCGAYNANLIKAAYEFMEKHRESEVVLEVVGKKANEHFRRRNYPILKSFLDRLAMVDLALAEEVSEPLTQGFLEGRFDRVYLLYNQFRSVMQQQITVEQLLPITALEVEEEPPPFPPGVDYIYEQPRESIYRDLFPQHVLVQVYRALVESTASEHGARMAAMEAATKNAGEMIDRLTLFRNRVRQATITRELIEIVSGAAALG
jgi:F-type H+-transporting ATPase subunit gamma